MPAARDLIDEAFRANRVYAPGEIVADTDMVQGFVRLNAMLDSWSTGETLTCFATLEQSTTLVPGVSAYTIGVGGTLDTVRPIRINRGAGSAYVQDGNGNRFTLEVVDRDRWNQLGNISTINADIPAILFYDPQLPWGILNFYPIPSLGYQAFWDSFAQLAAFPDLWTDVDLPPGYAKGLSDNLALELEPYYPTAVITPKLAKAAAESKANLKRANKRENLAQYDSEIVAHARASYNIYRGR